MAIIICPICRCCSIEKGVCIGGCTDDEMHDEEEED
jgi:hypothetical protein